jgi:hypothetical protein
MSMGTRRERKKDANTDEEEKEGADDAWGSGWEENGCYTLFAAFVEFSMMVRRRENELQFTPTEQSI